MWKVRFFGIDEKGYRSLKDAKDNFFSSNSHGINDSNFIEYFIHIVGHDDDEPTRILEIAEEDLKLYNTFLMLNGYNYNLTVDYPCKINADGTSVVYAFFEDHINITNVIETSINGNMVYSSDQEKKDNNKKLLDKVLGNETKRELFILLGSEKNWINAYKIYEIIKCNFQNESQLKKYDELKDFAHSANSPKAIGIDNARHAVQTHDSPKIISDLDTSHKKLIDLSLEYINQNT